MREALAARAEPSRRSGARPWSALLVRQRVRRFINQRFDRKPIVLPVVLEV